VVETTSVTVSGPAACTSSPSARSSWRKIARASEAISATTSAATPAGPAAARWLQKKVLDAVGLVEHDREEVPRLLAEQAERDREPLLGEVAETAEVSRHRSR